MISLVRESLVTKFKRQNEQINVQSIMGAQVKIEGQIDLNIDNTLEPLVQKCYIVGSLPRNLDIILGQDLLEKAVFNIQKRTPVIISPYSEQVIKCKTKQ
jgi:hypothetical protein